MNTGMGLRRSFRLAVLTLAFLPTGPAGAHASDQQQWTTPNFYELADTDRARYQRREPDADSATRAIPLVAAANTGDDYEATSPISVDADVQEIFPTYEALPQRRPSPNRWSSFLPIWGDAVREQGFDLPLPLGVSVNYIHLERDVDVEDIDISVDAGSRQSVSQLLQVSADSSVDVVISRFDAWVLPFLNVYTYGGWQWNKSNVEVAVTIPTPGPLPDIEFTVEDDGKLDGPVFGGGAALAVGYESLFLTSTVDFAFAKFDEFDSDFEGRVYGVRTGWNGEVGELPLRLWTGATYYDTATTIKGSVNVAGTGSVRYRVRQGPENPWNYLVGTNFGAGDRVDLTFEYGFNFRDVQSWMGGATYRF
jgi:hypothetical protein